MQLIACTDIEYGLSFWQSTLFLWLNYHCVHHLCPTTDQWHHPAIQSILDQTCKEFKLTYSYMTITEIFVSMMKIFGGTTYAEYKGKPDMLPNYQVKGFQSTVEPSAQKLPSDLT